MNAKSPIVRSPNHPTLQLSDHPLVKPSSHPLLRWLALLAVLSTLSPQRSTVFAQGTTAFTYQGKLSSGADAANGSFDLTFSLYDALSGGSQVGSSLTNSPVGVTNGLFTTTLDFGASVFNGDARWLEMGVRTNGAASFTTLSPRQALTPTPYAIMAAGASNVLGTLPASQLSGTVGNSQLANSSITVNAGAGLGGGGAVPLGGSTTLSNTGVRSVSSSPDITASTVNGTVTLAITATSFNTPNRIVKRDSAGNFFAGTITANLAGGATFATNLLGPLAGDVTGTQPATIVSSVGGQTATAIASGASAANAATDTNTPETIVKRDASGNITVGDLQATRLNVGTGHTLSGALATIAGGTNNTAVAEYAAIGGGGYNTIEMAAPEAFIGGGYNNRIQANSPDSFIGGGYDNTVQADAYTSVIAGGDDHTIQSGAYESAIGGGYGNIIGTDANSSVIAGGHEHTIQSGAYESAIGGGFGNTIQVNAHNSVIGGGSDNMVSGRYGTVPGGVGNVATNFAFAAGQWALATNTGAFVWSDGSGGAFGSTGPNQFLIRAAGGVGIGTNNPQSALHVAGTITADNFTGSAAGLTNISGLTIQQNTNGAPNIIAGSSVNFVAGGVVGATISGGGTTNYYGLYSYTNSVTGDFGTVGGGRANTASWDGTVGGGTYNTVSGSAATVGGGDFNTASGQGATVGGGYNNTASSWRATVGGGDFNTASGQEATAGGGYGNSARGDWATVGGGIYNTASNSFATVGGGHGNTASAYADMVGGGLDNTARGGAATVGGGYRNQATNGYATVAGGRENLAGGDDSFAAGHCAKALHQGTFVWADSAFADFASTTTNQFSVRASGGVRLVTSGAGLTVDGAPVLSGLGLTLQQNTNGAPNIIAGSAWNFVSSSVVGATISGGGATNYFGDLYTNSVTADFGTVGGGAQNTASGWFATVGGGDGNLASSEKATVGGGGWNTASAYEATVGGGGGNTANGSRTTVGGGYANRASGPFATVGGGRANSATNLFATVPGGTNNLAGGAFSFAAGCNANATNDGAFVWSDSTGTVTGSTSANSVTFRASGGYRLFTDARATLGVYLAPSGGSWTSMSDRNAKEHFQGVEPGAVLDKVAALPLQTWNYKSQDPGIRHIGPMAQDFKAAFGVGESDTGITTIDADGVALAAIQGLNQKLQQKKTEMTELRQEVAELKALVRQVTTRISGGGQ